MSLAANAVSAQMNKVTVKSNVDKEADKSALETRAVQLKDIDGDYEMAFRASMDVLQDMGFTIAQTNMETGHLVVTSEIGVVRNRGRTKSRH